MCVCAVFLALQLEVTRYEELEDLVSEVKLKQTMWSGLEEWAKLTAGWFEVREHSTNVLL